jgi:hypothetical protein
MSTMVITMKITLIGLIKLLDELVLMALDVWIENHIWDEYGI